MVHVDHIKLFWFGFDRERSVLVIIIGQGLRMFRRMLYDSVGSSFYAVATKAFV
jgi:hypothetical protein